MCLKSCERSNYYRHNSKICWMHARIYLSARLKESQIVHSQMKKAVCYDASLLQSSSIPLLATTSESTSSQWLSKFYGQPGFTQQSFDTIATNVIGDKSWKYKMCALHIDEMKLKMQIDYDRRTGKTHGFTDIGSGRWKYRTSKT